VVRWGLAVVGFGCSGTNLVLACAFLAAAGAADVISAVFRSSTQQRIVPDSLRGRISARNILVVAGGVRLGDFEAGIGGSLFSPFGAVVTSGFAVSRGRRDDRARGTRVRALARRRACVTGSDCFRLTVRRPRD